MIRLEDQHQMCFFTLYRIELQHLIKSDLPVPSQLGGFQLEAKEHFVNIRKLKKLLQEFCSTLLQEFCSALRLYLVF